MNNKLFCNNMWRHLSQGLPIHTTTKNKWKLLGFIWHFFLLAGKYRSYLRISFSMFLFLFAYIHVAVPLGHHGTGILSHQHWRMREDRYHTKLYRIRIIWMLHHFILERNLIVNWSICTHHILINSSWQVTLGGKGRGEGAKFMPG